MLSELKQERSITKDFRLLPSVGDVGDRIKFDAQKIAENIQDRLVKLAPDCKDGRVKIEEDVTDFYRSNVEEVLNKWAKMQNYKINYQGKNIEVVPINAKFKKLGRVCDLCDLRIGKRFEFLFIPLAFGLSIGAGLSLGALEFPVGWFVFSFITFLAGVGICWASEYHLDSKKYKEIIRSQKREYNDSLSDYHNKIGSLTKENLSFMGKLPGQEK